MAEIVNLRRLKKQKARAEKEKDAEVNRVRFGTPKSEQRVNSARSEKARTDLEGKKLDPDKPLKR
jgi:hypothetical protein